MIRAPPLLDKSLVPGIKNSPERDAVDELIARWVRERPELSLGSTEVVGRILRLNHFVMRREEQVLAPYRLHSGEFNVLAALRREGPHYQLAPNELQARLLVSSGALTNRIDRLEAARLVKRVPDPVDRRSVQIKLTPAGRRGIDGAIEKILVAERELLAPLSASERKQLAALLRRLVLPQEQLRPRRSRAAKTAAP